MSGYDDLTLQLRSLNDRSCHAAADIIDALAAERDAAQADNARLRAAIGPPEDSYDIELTPEARAGWTLAMNRIVAALAAAPTATPDPKPHLFAGSNPERQSIGHPGHCDRCAEVGHVKAHPELGCSDVGCYSHHDEPAAPTATPDVRPVGLTFSRDIGLPPRRVPNLRQRQPDAPRPAVRGPRPRHVTDQ